MCRLISNLLFAAGALLLPAVSHAAVERWPLEKIVAQSIASVPETKALVKEIEQAEALARQAGKWKNPDALIGYGPMTQGGLHGSNLDLSLRQAIPFFGQISVAERLSSQERETMQIEAEEKTLIIRHEVTMLSYRLAAVAEEEKHIAHRRESVRATVRFLESRPHASPAQAVEKSLIQNRLREIEEDLLEIAASKVKYWQALNVFLGREEPLDPIISWNEPVTMPVREGLWRKIQEQNPALRAKESALAAAQIGEDLAGKKAYPDIRLGFDYNQQTAEFPQRVYAGVLEFSLPVVDRGGYAKTAATAKREAESFRLEQARRELAARFEQAWITLVQCQKKLELYPAGLLPSSEKEFQRGEDGWKKGLVTTTAFLELEHQMHAQAVRYYGVRVEYVEALGELLKMTGRYEGGWAR